MMSILLRYITGFTVKLKKASGMSGKYCSLAACDNMSSILIMSSLWRVARWRALKKKSKSA